MSEILNAEPTDGLWEDGRTDKDQLGGLSYDELEWAMEYSDNHNYKLSDSEEKILDIYLKNRKKNLHKMGDIPIFKNN